jgi:hypothetical protein
MRPSELGVTGRHIWDSSTPVTLIPKRERGRERERERDSWLNLIKIITYNQLETMKRLHLLKITKTK